LFWKKFLYPFFYLQGFFDLDDKAKLSLTAIGGQVKRKNILGIGSAPQVPRAAVILGRFEVAAARASSSLKLKGFPSMAGNCD
jgi:hypothetical protein